MSQPEQPDHDPLPLETEIDEDTGLVTVTLLREPGQGPSLSVTLPTEREAAFVLGIAFAMQNPEKVVVTDDTAGDGVVTLLEEDDGEDGVEN